MNNKSLPIIAPIYNSNSSSSDHECTPLNLSSKEKFSKKSTKTPILTGQDQDYDCMEQVSEDNLSNILSGKYFIYN